MAKGNARSSVLGDKVKDIVMKEIDLKDPKIKERLAYVKKAQQEGLSRKNFDRKKMSTIVGSGSYSSRIAKIIEFPSKTEIEKAA